MVDQGEDTEGKKPPDVRNVEYYGRFHHREKGDFALGIHTPDNRLDNLRSVQEAHHLYI